MCPSLHTAEVEEAAGVLYSGELPGAFSSLRAWVTTWAFNIKNVLYVNFIKGHNRGLW